LNYPFLTQKERDLETGLDYFGARYYGSTQGRFTSVDPENAGANPDVPQSWNGYAYTGGNPLMFTDPDGREYLVCGPNGKDGKCTTVSDEQFQAERKALKETAIFIPVAATSTSPAKSRTLKEESSRRTCNSASMTCSIGSSQRLRQPSTRSRWQLFSSLGSVLLQEQQAVAFFMP
jgi:RHS repeat-associated protein